MTQVILTLTLDSHMTYFGHKSHQIGVTSQNSAYGHFEDQGQSHLGHVTPCWTCLVIVDKGFSSKL